MKIRQQPGRTKLYLHRYNPVANFRRRPASVRPLGVGSAAAAATALPIRAAGRATLGPIRPIALMESDTY